MPESLFPPGTTVCVTETTARRAGPIRVQTVGVVESWEELPTGSWYAHSGNDRLWLRRLKLRKPGGEITLLVVDNGTSVATVSAAPG